MGNMYSQTSEVIIKVNPYFYNLNEDKITRDKIKNFTITKKFNFTANKIRKSANEKYIFGIDKFKIIKSSFSKKEFIFHIKYTNPVYTSQLESYVEDAYAKYCNSGDSLKANFIQEKKYKTKSIYFSIDNIDFNYL